MKAPGFILVAATFLLTGAAYAGDAEFDRIVRAIESRYGAHPVHVPFMDAANFVLKVAHPEGASGVKLAVFEDIRELKSADDPETWQDRDRLMDSISGGSLHPLLREHSRGDGQATYIFVEPESAHRQSTRLLIATFGRNDATVIEVKANIDHLLKSLQDPEHASHELGAGRSDF